MMSIASRSRRRLLFSRPLALASGCNQRAGVDASDERATRGNQEVADRRRPILGERHDRRSDVPRFREIELSS